MSRDFVNRNGGARQRCSVTLSPVAYSALLPHTATQKSSNDTNLLPRTLPVSYRSSRCLQLCQFSTEYRNMTRSPVTNMLSPTPFSRLWSRCVVHSGSCGSWTHPSLLPCSASKDSGVRAPRQRATIGRAANARRSRIPRAARRACMRHHIRRVYRTLYT